MNNEIEVNLFADREFGEWGLWFVGDEYMGTDEQVTAEDILRELDGKSVKFSRWLIRYDDTLGRIDLDRLLEVAESED